MWHKNCPLFAAISKICGQSHDSPESHRSSVTLFDLRHFKLRPHLVFLLHFAFGLLFYLKTLNRLPNSHCAKSPDGVSNAGEERKEKKVTLDDEECERGTKRDKRAHVAALVFTSSAPSQQNKVGIHDQQILQT